MGKNPQEIRKEIENNLRILGATTEHNEMLIHKQSELLFIRYNCLIEVGFDRIQALEIVKARGLT